MRIRVGIVGCGLVAQIAHLPYLQELSHLFEITALCDISASLVDRLCRQYDVSAGYVDYRELVEQGVDAVFVLTRDHAPVAVAAAERGKHVFVEKPIAFNLEQADHMIRCAEENGVKLMVGYMKRYDPGFERAQEIFEDMEGGGLIRVHNSVGSPSRMTREMYDVLRPSDVSEEELAAANAKEAGSLLQAIGPEREGFLSAYSLLLHLWSHDINLLRGAFGDPREVRYAGVQAGTLDSDLPNLQVLGILDYGPDLACIWETKAFSANEWWDEEIALFGDERTVRVRFPFPYRRNAPATVRVEKTVGGVLVEQEVVASYDEAYKRELKHFYECVANDVHPLTDGEDGRKDLELAISMIQECSANLSSSD
ncbi:MAG: Gfo/Idh/MocA family protein [bacterium]